MHEKDMIGLNSEGTELDTDSYIPHSLWRLSDYLVGSINSGDRYFDTSQNVLTEDVIISFKLKRQPLYFIINNIFPCLILNFVTLLAFSLPFATQIGLSKKKCLLNSHLYMVIKVFN